MAISLNNVNSEVVRAHKRIDELASSSGVGVTWSKTSPFQPQTNGGPYTSTSDPITIATLNETQMTSTFLYISWNLYPGSVHTQIVPVFTFKDKQLILESLNYNINGAKTDKMGVYLNGNKLQIIHYWMYSRGTIHFMYLFK